MKKAFIVVGLGYGDEGKGSWVDYLCRKHQVSHVVRFNGGAQAAHHVVTPEGIWHRFAQFGSGTFVPGVKTCLSHYVLVNPAALFKEAEILMKKGISRPFDRMIIDENCPIITPVNVMFNKLLELNRGLNRHGSCGAGIGVTQEEVDEFPNRALYMRDFYDPTSCLKKLRDQLERRLAQAREILCFEGVEKHVSQLANIHLQSYVDFYYDFVSEVKVVSTKEMYYLLQSGNNVVFEGAQGALLDQFYGFFPHVTRSSTTSLNAKELLSHMDFDSDETIGLLRGYGTRHGHGPFLTEDSTIQIPACDNKVNDWQGDFRLGWFDCVAARYALENDDIDTLALTNLDRMNGLPFVRICTEYNPQTQNSRFYEEGDLLVTSYNVSEERILFLLNCQPAYELSSSWKNSFSLECQDYIRRIGDLLQKPVGAISVSSQATGKLIFEKELVM